MGEGVDLKPCPFCGGVATASRIGRTWRIECLSDACVVLVQASSCDPQGAVTAWNRRTPPDA